MNITAEELQAEIDEFIQTTAKLNQRMWTEREEAILRAARQNDVPDRETAKYLKRSMGSIRNKATQMGLTSPRRDMPHSWGS